MAKANARTKENAKQFDYMSEQAYIEVKEQLDCDCEPYEDVLTLPRWNALGYKIKKGSKAIRKTVWIEQEKKDKETGEITKKKFPKNTNLFCKCQVEKSPKK